MAKLDPSGASLVYGTFLGGSAAEVANGVAIDPTGAVFVTGTTASSNFPITPGAYDTTHSDDNVTLGDEDAFVVKLVLPTCSAPWTNYGGGWPGTNGVPGLTATGDPVLCAPLTLDFANSSGTASTAALFIGLKQTDLPTVFGGHLVLLPINTIVLSLPVVGLLLPRHCPAIQATCGLSIFLQALEIDSGAWRGVSFTQGLQLVLGT